MNETETENEASEPIENAIMSLQDDGDTQSAIAWALVDIAFSLREANEFKRQHAEQTEKAKADLFGLLPQVMGMFGGGGVKVVGQRRGPDVLCECDHDISLHEEDRCSGSVSDTIEGVPIQGACACVEFKLSTK